MKYDEFDPLLKASLEPLPENKPKLAYGLSSPGKNKIKIKKLL